MAETWQGIHPAWESLVLHGELTSHVDQEKRAVMAWVSSLSFDSKQKDFFDRRQEGTGEWLFEADAFKSWLDGTERILWCSGLPGAGKTILASTVVDYLNRSFTRKEAAVAYIYCNYKEQKNQTVVNLITSLLLQLVQINTDNTDIPNQILTAYHEHNDIRPTLAACSQLLQSEIRRHMKVFIVIDAPDECSESNGTRDGFLAEIRKLLPSIRLFVTSRQIPAIEGEFKKAARLEIRASDGDIKKYLQGRIGRERRLADFVKADSVLQDAILTTIVENAKGIFLMAQLYMDSLAGKLNIEDVHVALRSLPKEPSSAYDEALRRIESQGAGEAKLAKEVLYWVSGAFRPLTVTEIQHALAVTPGEGNFDRGAITDRDTMISVCDGLVTIDRGDDVVRLVHSTAQQHFEHADVRNAWFPATQADIAKTCLTYMSFDAFAEGCGTGDKEYEDRLLEYPFLEYATLNWGDHARGPPEEEVKELALRFLQHDQKVRCSSQVMGLNSRRYLRKPTGYTEIGWRPIGLQIAAYFGLAVVAGLLIGDGAEVNARDEYGGTALSVAAAGGHIAVVQLLLDKGADITAKDIVGQTAIGEAARGGREAVVKLLLEKGADVAVGNASQTTALILAAECGHEAVVKLLLENGTTGKAMDAFGQEALSAAAMNGYEAVVALLLENGASPDAKDKKGETVLVGVAAHGYDGVVQQLLSRDASPNAKNQHGEPAVISAVTGRHIATLRALLSHSADANARTRAHEPALMAAAERDDTEAMAALLDHGADVDARDDFDITPLVLAAGRGYAGAVALLLARGADPAAADGYGRTAAVAAGKMGHAEVLTLLLAERGS